jgi:hypothetical protein
MSTILAQFKLKLKDFTRKIFRHSNLNSQKISAHKSTKITIGSHPLISQQEYDAFRMKAIVLLKKDSMLGIPLHALLKDPVQVKIGNGDNQKVVVQLSQRFEWSGRVYHCEGEFLRDPTKKIHSIPLSKTFKITQKI